MDAVIEYAMQTPDGAWRVEVIKRGRTRRHRVIHGDNELDWLSIAAVQRILTEADVDLADLTEVADQPPASVNKPRHGQPEHYGDAIQPPRSGSPPDCTRPWTTKSALTSSR
jgi:hypothetical protein